MRAPTTTTRAAPVLDALCIVVFVVAGRRSHGIDRGLDWFLTVVWPFLTGWFAVAVFTRLYARPLSPVRAHVLTVVAGVLLAVLLRGVFTSRGVEGPFVVVAAVFLAVTTLGWRAIAGRVSRRRKS